MTGVQTCALPIYSDTMISDAEQSGTDNADSSGGPEQWQKEGAPYIDVELLTPNEYSRPQIPIESVQYIAIHYTANPGATAIANRNYFENLATTHDTKVSSHFVVGLDGEVVQCIPTSEIWFNEAQVELSFVSYMKIMWPMLQSYFGKE